MIRPIVAAAALLLAGAPLAAQAQRTLRVVVAGDPSLPIPGLSAATENQRIADILFLRLGAFTGTSAGDAAAVPELARSWRRVDDRTLVFELDPRARWHDGRPVTPADVVYSFGRAQDPARSPQDATLLRDIEWVRADGDRRVAFRFRRAYPEQLYDATFHVRILPAHLLTALPQDRLDTTAFARAPVGTGPYRWSRYRAGEFLELARVERFFLGTPWFERLVFRPSAEPATRLNLLLAGDVDVMPEFTPPLANLARLEGRDDVRLARIPTYTVGYLLFNQRAFGDRAQPHPILADPAVRRALTLALDVATTLRAVFGEYGVPMGAPIPAASWLRTVAPPPPAPDTARARRLLAEAGWRDTDGDGTLDRNGAPLRLVLNVPSSSAPRMQMAAVVQQQWRRLGVDVVLEAAEGPVWASRRTAGRFDVDFSAATQDPSPSGLVQSWTCAGIGGSNVAGYCNPRVDSLLDAARLAPGDARAAWAPVLRAIADDAIAVPMYASDATVAYPAWLRTPELRPESYWRAIWRWRPAAAR